LARALFGAPLLGRLLASMANIRLAWYDFARPNDPAYFEGTSTTIKTSFM
jgi:hypothetical protein